MYEGNTAYFDCFPNTSIPLNDLLNKSYWGAIQPISSGQPLAWIRNDGDKQSVLADSDEFVYLPNGGLLIPHVPPWLSIDEHRNTDEHGVSWEFCCIVFNRPQICGSLAVLPTDGINTTLTLAVEPFNLTLKVRETGVVPCVGAGVPSPTVTWYKPGGKTVNSGDGNVGTSAVLIIRRSTVKDSGIYRCVVNNSKGWIDRNISVVVSGKPYLQS